MSIRSFRFPPARAAGLVATASALMLGAACSTSKLPAAPVMPPPPVVTAVPVVPVVEDPARAALVVSASQSGAQVVMRATQELRVELVDSTATVAAGFEWSVATVDPKVLASLGLRFERATWDVNVFESAGTTIFRFRPLGPGHTVLAFELRKPRTREQPAETVRFDVTVR